MLGRWGGSFAEAVKLLDLEMYLQHSGMADKLNYELIRDLNAFSRATLLCIKRAEFRMSGPAPMVTLVMRRMSSNSSLE